MRKGDGSTRLVLAERHALFSETLKAVLEAEPDMCVVGSANDGRSLLVLVEKLKPDVVVLAADLPNGGLDLTSILKRSVPGITVLVIVNGPDDDLLDAALIAGADGCLTRGSTLLDLIHGIRTLNQGGRFLTPKMVDRVIERMLRLPNLLEIES